MIRRFYILALLILGSMLGAWGHEADNYVGYHRFVIKRGCNELNLNCGGLRYNVINEEALASHIQAFREGDVLSIRKGETVKLLKFVNNHWIDEEGVNADNSLLPIDENHMISLERQVDEETSLGFSFVIWRNDRGEYLSSYGESPEKKRQVIDHQDWYDKLSTSFSEWVVTWLGIDRRDKKPPQNLDYTIVRKVTYFLVPLILVLMLSDWKKASLFGAPIAVLVGYVFFLALMLLRDAFLYALYYKNIDIAGYEFLTRYVCLAANLTTMFVVYNKVFMKNPS